MAFLHTKQIERMVTRQDNERRKRSSKSFYENLDQEKHLACSGHKQRGVLSNSGTTLSKKNMVIGVVPGDTAIQTSLVLASLCVIRSCSAARSPEARHRRREHRGGTPPLCCDSPKHRQQQDTSVKARGTHLTGEVVIARTLSNDDTQGILATTRFTKETDETRQRHRENRRCFHSFRVSNRSCNGQARSFS